MRFSHQRLDALIQRVITTGRLLACIHKQKRACCFLSAFPALCLSRACLGKTIVSRLDQKWSDKTTTVSFLTVDFGVTAAVLNVQRDRFVCPCVVVVQEVNIEGVLRDSVQKMPRLSSQLFLCLSPACLGKMIIFCIKWLKKAAFSRLYGAV